MSRILLVDDDIAEISAVKRVLQRGGHQLVLATNASDALASVAKSPPDLVVLALACENGDGSALARQLLHEPADGIPLVLLGEGDLGGVAAQVVPQPIDPVVLEDALRAALERAVAPSPRPHLGDERQAAAEALLARAQELRTPSPAPTPPSSPAEEEELAIRAAAATWFDAEGPALDVLAQPLDAAAFERPDGVRGDGEAQQLGTGKLDEERRRRASEVAQVESAQEEAKQHRSAQEDGLREAAAKSADALRRHAEDEVQRRVELEAEAARLADSARRAQEEREAAQDAARRAVEEAEARRAAVAEAARRRVLALARERATAATARPSGADAPEALAPELAQGSLAAVSMPRLLALAARGRATGRLDVATEFPRALWLEQGRVVGARSTAPGERTEDVALRLGLITRQQHRRVSPDTSGLASRRVGALLLERGFLKPSELALLARRRAEEIAFALFSGEARYRLELGAPVPTDERLALDRGTLALAVEGVRRRWESPRLEAVLGGAGTLVAPAARAAPVADLGLSGEERRVCELADGLRTLDEILACAPLDPLSSRQMLAALVEVGVLEVKILGPVGAPVASPGSIDLARIDEKLDQVRRADYFVILGLGRACTPYEIREAAERLLSELALERFDALGAEGLPAKLEEIRQVLEEARDILSDDVLRAEYLAGLGE